MIDVSCVRSLVVFSHLLPSPATDILNILFELTSCKMCRFCMNCVASRDLVPFVQFKKCEKHPWKSVTFRAWNFKGNAPLWVFCTFFKLCKWCQIAQSTTIVCFSEIYITKIYFRNIFYGVITQMI